MAHDTIALHISEQRDGDEVALLEVAKLIQDRYDVFNRTNTLLNSKELQLIANYETRLLDRNKSHLHF